MPNRYYAQACGTDPFFKSNHHTSWQVFDREWLTYQGECVAIAMCVNRTQALKIRDALNAK